jgi:biotin carboxyl carrier protein
VKRFEVLLNEKAYLVEVTKISAEGALVSVNGTPYEIGIKDLTAMETPQMMVVSASAPAAPAAPAAAPAKSQAAVETVGGLTTIKAPLPGLILDVKVSVGDTVKVGDVIIVIETMKMENNISSPVAGTIKEIKVSSGDSVSEGVPLIVIGE